MAEEKETEALVTETRKGRKRTANNYELHSIAILKAIMKQIIITKIKAGHYCFTIGKVTIAPIIHTDAYTRI